MNMSPTSHHLIIGCGYLGKRLLALLDSQTCWYTRRTQFPDKRALLFDINNEATWHNLDSLSSVKELTLYCMIPPSQIELACFSDCIEQLNQLNTKRSILVSSTVVYGSDDRTVDADSDVNIDNKRAERQYRIEQDWLTTIKNGLIVRLAGIYGPERIIGKTKIINGGAISGNPEGWLNLIHVDDAARLVKCIGEMQRPATIELASDGQPIKRQAYYAFLAEALKKAQPKFNDDITRNIGRRCDNRITIERTGWQPEHVDFRKVLSNLINKQ